uniref:B30.2/SPRY domain-containing protein n=1 Tax=Eptatretus burgeri TaxID=7764 RepID=A0A8C4QX49_EPTBU
MKDVESQMQELKQEIEETQHSDKESEKTLEWKRRGMHQVVDESVNIMKRWLNERRRVKLAHLEQKKQKLQQHTNFLCGTESAMKTALQELESVVFLQDCKKVLHSLEAQSHVTFTESAPPALLEFPAVERPANSCFQVNDNLLKEIRKEFVKHLKISDVGCSSLKSLYGCIPSLDAKSAHPRIVISEDLRTATRTDNAEPYPEHPDRFVSWHQVSAESFSSGRHYWEVDVSLRHYYWVGVAFNSMARKGKCGKLGRNPESWCVEKLNKRYFVWHDDEGTTFSVPGNPERIGFLLDCEGGELTCFGDSRLLYVFRGNFTDPVKPVMGFGFGRGSMRFCECCDFV